MLIRGIILAAGLLGGAGLTTSLAVADSETANCEVHYKGDLKRDKTGPCHFSQRQGYVTITLKDGAVWELSPTDQANHYRDQDGHELNRSMEGQTQVYKWKHRTFKVSFGGAPAGGNSGGSHGSHGAAGTPVQGLQDLIGQVGGEAEDKLINRGYEVRNSSDSGKDTYSNWQHRKTGQCITLRTQNGKYLSIVYSTDFDCNQG